jgi:hypothetical protein
MLMLPFEVVHCTLRNADGRDAGLGFAGRAEVPGGWLLIFDTREKDVVFIPDPEHEWELSAAETDGKAPVAA